MCIAAIFHFPRKVQLNILICLNNFYVCCVIGCYSYWCAHIVINNRILHFPRSTHSLNVYITVE